MISISFNSFSVRAVYMYILNALHTLFVSSSHNVVRYYFYFYFLTRKKRYRKFLFRSYIASI